MLSDALELGTEGGVMLVDTVLYGRLKGAKVGRLKSWSVKKLELKKVRKL